MDINKFGHWSQNFTVKSNARRAARAEGVDPAKVVAIKKAGRTLYRFPLPAAAATESKGERQVRKTSLATDRRIKKGLAAKKAAKARKTDPRQNPSARKAQRAATRANLKAEKAAAPKGDRGLKFIAVAALLRRDGGASITEVCAATGWKPHSARARISVDVSKLLDHSEEIQRRREAGVSWYAIVKSKQLDLPIDKPSEAA